MPKEVMDKIVCVSRDISEFSFLAVAGLALFILILDLLYHMTLRKNKDE